MNAQLNPNNHSTPPPAAEGGPADSLDGGARLESIELFNGQLEPADAWEPLLVDARVPAEDPYYIPDLPPLPCPDCGARMFLARWERVRSGLAYVCEASPACFGMHGAHPDGEPLGTPADYAGRKARVRAHRSIDQLRRRVATLPMVGDDDRIDVFKASKGWVYRWLAQEMALTITEAHVGVFDPAQCAEVARLCDATPPERFGALVRAFQPFIRLRRAMTDIALREADDGDRTDEEKIKLASDGVKRRILKWLAQELGQSVDDFEIGGLDPDACRRVAQLCARVDPEHLSAISHAQEAVTGLCFQALPLPCFAGVDETRVEWAQGVALHALNAWLARKLNRQDDEVRIRRLDRASCQRIVRLCQKMTPALLESLVRMQLVLEDLTQRAASLPCYADYPGPMRQGLLYRLRGAFPGWLAETLALEEDALRLRGLDAEQYGHARQASARATPESLQLWLMKHRFQ